MGKSTTRSMEDVARLLKNIAAMLPSCICAMCTMSAAYTGSRCMCAWCRAGIIPLDNTSDVAGPVASSVEDVAERIQHSALLI